VQFTYGFVLVMFPVIAVETALTVQHTPMGAALIPAIAWGCAGGGGFVMMIQTFKRTKNGRRAAASPTARSSGSAASSLGDLVQGFA
jgi:hypothetical protein